MKKRILAVVLTVATLSGVLSGCATTESVVDRMFKAMSKYDSQSANVNLGVKADLAVSGVSLAVDFGLDGSYEYQQIEDNQALLNFEGDLNIEMLGESESVSLDMYAELEDTDKDESEATIYLKTSEDDTWLKQVETIEGTFFDGRSVDTSFLKEHLVLSKELVEYDGVKCYELTGDVNLNEMLEYLEEIESEQYDEIVDEMGDSFEVLEDIGDYIVMDISYLVNKKTYLPVQASIDFANSDFNKIIEYAIEESGESVEDEDYEFNFEKLGVEITYTQFGDIEIEIPDDALDAVDSSSMEKVDDFDIEEYSNDDYAVVEEVEGNTSDSDYTLTDEDYLEYVENYYPHVNEDETFGIETYECGDDVAVIITNLLDKEVVADGAVRFYDEDGNLVDASTISTSTLPANGECVEWAWSSKPYSTVEVALISDTVYEDALDLSYNFLGDDSAEEEVVYEITNNGDIDLDSEYFEVLFFKGGKLVDNGYLHRESSDETLKAGESDEYRCYYTEDWDECMVFLEAFTY